MVLRKLSNLSQHYRASQNRRLRPEGGTTLLFFFFNVPHSACGMFGFAKIITKIVSLIWTRERPGYIYMTTSDKQEFMRLQKIFCS
jgi:hypothetical protein